MRLSEIRVFPVKSCRGRSLPAAEMTARGLAGDRRWMIVDLGGRFLTQRELPALARLAVEPTANGLLLAWQGEAVAVEYSGEGEARAAVSVWNDTLLLPEAASAGAALSRWFGRPLRLVHQPGDVSRPVGDWGEPQDQVSLADEFPLLIASTASLEELRRAAGVDLEMERFRPNLVIDGTPPWAEDGWATLRVGDVELDLLKPCARCTVTTVDPARGEVSGEEPLATLRRIRMSGDGRQPGVLFGWNAVPRSLGVVRVGDPVAVLRTRVPWAIRPPAEARRAQA